MNPDRDPLHVGSFTAWHQDTGETRKAPGAVIRVKRSRQMNRFVRRIGNPKQFALALSPNKGARDSMKFMLDMARKHFGGGIQNQ